MATSSLTRLADRAKKNATVGGVREVEIPMEKIRFDLTQPRKSYHHPDGQVAPKDEAYIAELAGTIDQQGLIHAITVEEEPDGTYKVVVGECRTRAHLLLGRETIRAVIRNDLTSPTKRLIYQLTENISRSDLNDAELAESVRTLMTGDPEKGIVPLSQVEISIELKKSEGWVSRYVRYGDEELQRLWVLTGIGDTVEKVYRLSLLPAHLQAEIQRRVNLLQDDPEYLAKPLNRGVIDGFTDEARVYKLQTAKKPEHKPAAKGREDSGAQGSGGAMGTESASNGTPAADDGVGRTLAGLAQEGRADEPTEAAGSKPAAQTKYELPADLREKILGNAASAGPVNGARTPAVPAVHCRAFVSNLSALLALLKSDEDLLASLSEVQCSISIPGPLAQSLANKLVGVVVDPKEMPATMQNELARLQ